MRYIVGLLFPVLFIMACKSPEGPSPVAREFITALQQRDYGTAARLGTPETVKLLKQFEKIEQLNGRDVVKESSKPVTIVSEDIRGRNATVYFKEEGNPLEQKVSLVRIKENGKQVWRVHLKKEEFQLMQHQSKSENPA